MKTLAIAVLSIVVAVLLLPIRYAGGAEPEQAKDDGKLVLPDITGLAGPDAAGPETINGRGKQISRLSVLVDKAGRARSEGQGAVQPWRGVNLPKGTEPLRIEAGEQAEYVVRLTMVDGKMRIEADGKAVADFALLGKALTDAKPRGIVVDAAGDVPLGAVVKTVAVAVERKLPVEFRAPAERNDKWRDEALRRLLAGEAAKHGSPDGLSELGLRISADERAPWASVQEVLMACMMAKVWRFSFAARLDGKEVVVGWVEGKAPKHGTVLARDKLPEFDPAKKRDIFREPADAVDRNGANAPEAPGIVGAIGVGEGLAGCFGYRDGGGRKKAVGRFGGSAATESSVEAALRWLARHQKADGSWEGEVAAVDAPIATGRLSPEEAAAAAGLIRQLGDNDFNRREEATKALIARGLSVRELVERATRSADPEVSQRAVKILEAMVSNASERPAADKIGCTGVALLAFLGAGYTAKNGQYQDNVKRGLAWIARQQKDDGSIGSGADHAIAGLALAEAYGMGRDPEIGKAAQRAVDCSVKARQMEFSGWGREPRKDPNLATTVWHVMQLKSAKIAGLKVEGTGFQGAYSFIDSATNDEGLCRFAPGKPSSAAMTAAGAWGRQIMGTPNTEPVLLKAAKAIGRDLPKEQSPGDMHYLHFATLAMFQMGGEPWTRWNDALKPLLVNQQSKGGPMDGSARDLDGSWSAGKSEAADKARVHTTALGALCLETYYRYLPMYAK